MAQLQKRELESALARLGELAAQCNEHIELLLLGGSVMVLEFGARAATRDVDAVILAPADRGKVRRMAEAVAVERGWSVDWLNDAAKGFLVAPVIQKTKLLTLPGLTVWRPPLQQLLAMKLAAWRDDVDINDARVILQKLSGTYEAIWQLVEPSVPPGRELKAKYAFDDLWESLHGSA